MDFEKLKFYDTVIRADGLIKITYHVGGDPTKPHVWSVPPQVDLESYGFDIPAFERQLIDTARLNYTPPED